MSWSGEAVLGRSYEILRRAYRLARKVKRRLAGTPEASVVTDTPYQAWLSERIKTRVSRYPQPDHKTKFSIITPVYERTNLSYFNEAASSILQQSHRNLEWVIVADGPIPKELLVEILLLRRDSRVHFFAAEKGGIIRTMRRAIEEATGDYVIPVDGDDLLAEDALRVFASVAQRDNQPAVIYSDEDHLVGGRPDVPYFRPDWDPVLNITSSWVWHVMAFSRKEALSLGVYSDVRSNWCQDWDTIFRFVDAGHVPVHIPEVLYHWRQHDASSTNQASPVSDSLNSQRHVLELHLARIGLSDRFEIAEFPIFRGAKEWWLRPRGQSTRRLNAIVMSSDSARAGVAVESLRNACGSRLEEIVVCGQDIESIREAASKLSGEIAIVIDDRVRPEGEHWLSEAEAQLDLHTDCDLISARLIDDQGKVLAGGEIFGLNGAIRVPSRGCAHDDGGMFALHLKPRSVSAADSRFFIARAGFLRSALSEIPLEASYTGLGAWLGAVAAKSGRRVIYSSLVLGLFQPGTSPWEEWSAREREQFGMLNADKIPDMRWYLPHAQLHERV